MLKCGQYCGTLQHCLYFFVHVGKACLICVNGTHDLDHLDEWRGEVLPNTKIWFKEKGQTYFIGYKTLINSGRADLGRQHSMVDLTPVPTRSKLISFLFNAGAVDREIRFGVYRRYRNTCIFELVQQWTTTSTHLGQNEYYINDFIVEKGYHIGFTFTQKGVIRKTEDSIQRYCSSKDAPVFNKQLIYSNASISFRTYSFQGKFISF